MIAYDYILFGQIQKTKIKYYAEHGAGLSFQDAVQMLIDRGQYQNGIPEKPDFLSWNLTNDRELRKRIAQIPIALSEMRTIKHVVQNDVRRLSIYNHVQISAEACYSDMQLISVSYFSVCYVLEGSCRLKLLREERVMYPGELCIIPPDVPYAIYTVPEDLVINIVSAREHFTENFSQLLYRDNLVSAFSGALCFRMPENPSFLSCIRRKISAA
ncbi:MAG: AraC family ligand binding domain-containing protein [Clostridiales bacterium]|nr:AraC family ligand binding domain-containing protein [Clostridiales bacterium]